jgi:acyl-coenzyme A synthetase/AMP-(fatty) acid ligase
VTSLRLALLGGDWIPVTLPDRLRVFAPALRFVALGGATEASIHSTLYEVRHTDPDWVSIPYGRPMANQRVYVLDAERQPVPPGVAGELYLAGDGLAHGYVGDPALTAARFVSSWTYGPVTGERLYRTGDLVRFDADGLLELLGRIDFQVKVRGVRIETGEVEAAVRRHPAVRACAVTATGATDATRRLVAYVVFRPGASATCADLRDTAAAVLPAGMVPARFVVLDALPLSPNGKVDRRALPDATPATAVGGRPRDEWEQRVVGAWQEILGATGIDRDSDFFALGGDSFAAMRIVQCIDPYLPVTDLFANPTVKRLAAHLRERATA